MKFLAEKRKLKDGAVVRLEVGLATLAKASEDTQVMQEELSVKNAEIAEKKGIVEELIADITQKSEIAGKQAKIATEKKINVVNPSKTVSFKHVEYEVSESNSYVEVTIKKHIFKDFTFWLKTFDGTAKDGSDYIHKEE